MSCINCDCYGCRRNPSRQEDFRDLERRVTRGDIAGRMRVIHARSQHGLDAAPFAIPMIVTVGTESLTSEEIEPINLWEFVNEVERALKIMEERGYIFPWAISTVERRDQERSRFHTNPPLWRSDFPFNFGEAARRWHEEYRPDLDHGSPALDLDWLEIGWRNAVHQISEDRKNGS